MMLAGEYYDGAVFEIGYGLEPPEERPGRVIFHASGGERELWLTFDRL